MGGRTGPARLALAVVALTVAIAPQASAATPEITRVMTGTACEVPKSPIGGCGPLPSSICCAYLEHGARFHAWVYGTGFESDSTTLLDGRRLFSSTDRDARPKGRNGRYFHVPFLPLDVGGLHRLTVLNPDGAESHPITFTILNPVPHIGSWFSSGLRVLEGHTVRAGGRGFTLRVEDSGVNSFVPGSVVRWNGHARPTTYSVTPGAGGTAARVTLRASIGAADIAQAGTAQVTVVSPGPGGGVSNSAPFAIAPR